MVAASSSVTQTGYQKVVAPQSTTSPCAAIRSGRVESAAVRPAEREVPRLVRPAQSAREDRTDPADRARGDLRPSEHCPGDRRSVSCEPRLKSARVTACLPATPLAVIGDGVGMTTRPQRELASDDARPAATPTRLYRAARTPPEPHSPGIAPPAEPAPSAAVPSAAASVLAVGAPRAGPTTSARSAPCRSRAASREVSRSAPPHHSTASARLRPSCSVSFASAAPARPSHAETTAPRSASAATTTTPSASRRRSCSARRGCRGRLRVV
jgi:hypothetical protein